VIYDTDPTQPIGTWKEGWEAAKERAGIDALRFHDLRHSGCTRLLDAGIPHPIVAQIMGWSVSTAIRMLKVYGHISLGTIQRAIEQRERFMQESSDRPQNRPQFQPSEPTTIQ
jgi:integrase